MEGGIKVCKLISMKYWLILLSFICFGCSQKPADELFTAESSRPSPGPEPVPPPLWASDAFMQKGDLRPVIWENNVAGFAPNYWGVKYERPTFGYRTLTMTEILRWGLQGTYVPGISILSYKILCPQANYSYTENFAIERNKGTAVTGVPNVDFLYPGFKHERLYKYTGGFLELISFSDKQHWAFSSGRRFIDSDSATGQLYYNRGGSGDTMWIAQRYMDTYYAWGTMVSVPSSPTIPQDGIYYFNAQINPYGYAYLENQSNNAGGAWFKVEGGIASWIDDMQGKPKPIGILDISTNRNTKTVSIIWGGANNLYHVYRNGVFLGRAETNGFSYFYERNENKGTYRVTSVIPGHDSTAVEFYYDGK